MNTYEQKQAAKRERLELAADRAEAKSAAAYRRADLTEGASGIPFGQPILVGHHSEGKHRAAIKRADNAMRSSIEADKRAGKLRARAEAVGTGGVSSDDPEAVTKLRQQLESCEATQKIMVGGNKAIRKTLKAHDADSPEALAMLTRLMEALAPSKGALYAEQMLKKDFSGRYGFASYQTTNNSANMRRLKKRIEQLERSSQRVTVKTSFQGVCDVIENVEENRVQFIFDGKPDPETRKVMKSHGFRWAPSQGAWQRQLNGNGIYAARLVLKELGLK